MMVTKRLLKLFLLGIFILYPAGANVMQFQPNHTLLVDDRCGPATMVFLGSSNMFYDGGGWVTRMVSRGVPWSGMNIINKGIAATGLGRYHRTVSVNLDITSHNPNYLLINLGGSDFLANKDLNPSQFKADYAEAIELILDEMTQNFTEVFLMNIIWDPHLSEYSSNQQAIYYNMQSAISELATQYDFEFIDSYNSTLDHPEHFSTGVGLLNEDGYNQVAEKVHNVTAPIITENEAEITACPTPSSTSTTSEIETSISTTPSEDSTLPTSTNEAEFNYLTILTSFAFSVIVIRNSYKRKDI